MRISFNALLLAASLFASGPALAGEKGITIHKDPYCGCCQAYADHLEANGFTVTVEETEDIAAASRAAGIPEKAQGCHWAQIDGYIVSGHVPLAALDKLLSERPDIKGIALPGMPLGAPGMGDRKEGPLETVAISRDGAIAGVYHAE